MNIAQKQQFDSLNEALVALQNKCNRAQSALLQAEQSQDEEAIDRLLTEAGNELIESIK